MIYKSFYLFCQYVSRFQQLNLQLKHPLLIFMQLYQCQSTKQTKTLMPTPFKRGSVVQVQRFLNCGALTSPAKLLYFLEWRYAYCILWFRCFAFLHFS